MLAAREAVSEYVCEEDGGNFQTFCAMNSTYTYRIWLDHQRLLFGTALFGSVLAKADYG